MTLVDKMNELNDENLLLVCNMVETLYAAQSKRSKKTKTKTKTIKASLASKKKEHIVEPNVSTDEDDDEWEVRPKKKKARPNKFLKMPEFNAHKEDTAWAKKYNVYNQAPVPRREATTLIEINCYKCQRKFKISPNLVPPGDCRIKCNNCAKGGGG